jgi:RNA polymerase sigma factor (sigma-70 family)
VTAFSEQAATGSQPATNATAGEAIEGLYREHGLGLVRLAVMLTGDQPTAEDVVQEAFIGLYRGWHRVRDQRDQATVLAYLRTAVVNGARSALRSRGRRNALLIKAARHDPPVWSAEAAAIDGEDRRALMAAVAQLTQRQREVLAFKYYLGLGENEIAALLRISRSTVSSTAARAVMALSRKLKERE